MHLFCSHHFLSLCAHNNNNIIPLNIYCLSETVCPLCSGKQQGSILVSLCLVKERFKECFQQVNTMIKDGVIEINMG